MFFIPTYAATGVRTLHTNLVLTLLLDVIGIFGVAGESAQSVEGLRSAPAIPVGSSYVTSVRGKASYVAKMEGSLLLVVDY